MPDLFKTLVFAAALCMGPASIAQAQDHGDYVDREDDSDVMNVSTENEEMNKAMETAVDTIDVFFDALESGEHPRESFTLKILTETVPGNFEHMWYIYYDFTEDEKISGILTHNPYAEGSDYKMGEIYQLEPTEVSDWRYVDGEKLRGDFTTRVILKFMAEDDPERAAAELAYYHENPLPK